jgi:hypothetical protein
MKSPLIQPILLNSILKRVYKNNLLSEFIFIHLNNLGSNVILAGGSLRVLFDKSEKINDFDLFFLGDSTAELEKAEKYFEDKIHGNRYKKIFRCKESKLVSFLDTTTNIKIQLINEKNNESVPSILNNFDFNACRFATALEDKYFWFYYSDQSIYDVKFKKLSLFNLIYPVATLKRACKYKNYGYNINELLISVVTFLSSPENKLTEDEKTRVYID